MLCVGLFQIVKSLSLADFLNPVNKDFQDTRLSNGWNDDATPAGSCHCHGCPLLLPGCGAKSSNSVLLVVPPGDCELFTDAIQVDF